MRLPRWLVLAAVLTVLVRPAWGQFEQGSDKGAKLDKPQTQKLKIGMIVTASGGPCAGIVATAPVPAEWPEQQVRLVDEQLTPNVKKLEFRTIGGGVKQMIVQIPQLQSGEEASAFAIFEVTRNAILPPDDTSQFRIPKKVPRPLLPYLGPSPYIESRNSTITKLAKEAGEGKDGWEKVEALYDAAREKVEYKEGPLKGALKALKDGTGDCEELSSLFIAMCRAEDIPARTVWVHDHCYAEFYLEDAEGEGHWFPCQPAGARAFGGIPEVRPVLQKGDNFRDPDRPKEKLRYVTEFMKGKAVKGGGQPKVKFVRE